MKNRGTKEFTVATRMVWVAKLKETGNNREGYQTQDLKVLRIPLTHFSMNK